MQQDSLWPEASGSAGALELADRWAALLSRAPRLRPFINRMVGRRRLDLQQSGIAQVEVERALWRDLSRWLQEFEVLPEFAVSAIAVTLEDEAAHEVEPLAPDVAVAAESPERAALDLDALLSDASFALAFHCVDTCVRPSLPSSPLERIPEADWFALLHAASRPQPALTAEVAIALVLHLLSAGWPRIPTSSRQAALRLFLADPHDLRGDLRPLCAALPAHWSLGPALLPDFAVAATKAKAAFAEAARLCARFASAVRERPGGLAMLADDAAPPPGPQELAALFRNVRKYRQLGGFRKLLSLL
jgi:hypothetical protein